MNALQKALVSAGLAEEPKVRSRRKRKVTCRGCGSEMRRVDSTNVIVCPNCKNYIIVDGK